MNPVPELAPHLKQLRLSGILDSLEARNRQAIDAKLAYTEFLALLIQDEVARREQKKFAPASAPRRLPRHQDARAVRLRAPAASSTARSSTTSPPAATSHERAPVLIVGPCGTGKSHLAQALGHCAVRQGVDVAVHHLRAASPRA